MALETIKFKNAEALFEIRTDLKDLKRQLRKLSKDVPMANVRAMNRGAKRGMTRAKQEIAKRRFLKAAQAQEGLSLSPATLHRPTASIKGRGKMLALTKLKTGIRNPKQTPLGVKANVAVGRRTLIPGAFIARMQSGHIGVFMRSRIGGSNRVGRLPIQEQVVPSIAHTLVNEEVSKSVLERYREAYQRELLGQYSRAIARAQKAVRS